MFFLIEVFLLVHFNLYLLITNLLKLYIYFKLLVCVDTHVCMLVDVSQTMHRSQLCIAESCSYAEIHLLLFTYKNAFSK